MKKGLKVIAAFLTIVTLALFIPAGNVTGEKVSIPELLDMKGSDFTDNSYMAEKLQELFDLLPYSDYPYFTTYGNKSCGNSICSYCNGRSVAKYHPNLKDLGVRDSYDSWSCFGFARYAFLYIFGTEANGLNYYGNTTSGTLRRVGRIASDTYDLNSLVGEYDEYTSKSLKELLMSATPGDIVQARTRKNGSTGNHTMIFLKADNDGMYVLQNNMYKNKLDANGNYYGYNRTMISYMTYTSIQSTWNSVVTVYRADKNTYTSTWNKGNNICLEHTYSAEMGDNCLDCGYKFQRQADTNDTGLYMLDYACNVRTQPYTGAERITTLPKGSVITVISSEINSLGEKWFRTDDNRYIYSNNLHAVKNTTNLTISMTSYPVGQLKLYSSFELRGKIQSHTGEIEKVTGMFISHSTGKVLQQATVTPNSSSIDIGNSNINYNLKFGQLSLGKYTFLMTVYDSDGNYCTFSSPFEISATVTTTKVEQKAPSKPSVATKYDTYIILEYDDGYEYSMDKVTWTTANLFSDLTPNTEYSFYRRIAETPTAFASPASPALTVKTLKIQKAAEAPTLNSAPTDTTVTLTYVVDYEYSKDGQNWQSSNVFKGLSPATDYAFYQRDKDTKLASKGLLVRTLKATLPAPEAPMVLFSSDVTVSIVARSGYEYAIVESNGATDIIWQTEGEFTGLSPASSYRVYCRIAETDTTFASPISQYTEVLTDKSYVDIAPDAPIVIAKNSTSITLKAVPGVEFSLDGETFFSSNVMTGLVPGATYIIVCRYAETETCYSSINSEEISVEIVPDKITSTAYTVDELNKYITDVPIGTSVGLLISNLDYGKYTKVYDGNRPLAISTPVATGNKIVVADEFGTSAEYTVIVKGDINGDGLISVTDLVVMLRIFSGKEPTALEFAAADITGDGYVNAVDYAIIKYMTNS